MMKITSKVCKQYICDWIKDNPNQLPQDVEHVARLAADPKWYRGFYKDGTKVSHWGRIKKEKVGDVTYRMFRVCGVTILHYNILMLVAEVNGTLTISYGDCHVFKNHPDIGRWFLDPNFWCMKKHPLGVTNEVMLESKHFGVE